MGFKNNHNDFRIFAECLIKNGSKTEIYKGSIDDCNCKNKIIKDAFDKEYIYSIELTKDSMVVFNNDVHFSIFKNTTYALCYSHNNTPLLDTSWQFKVKTLAPHWRLYEIENKYSE
ncbi:MAG: hypothetical protein U0V72_13915 [Cytophagales bacterium]